MADDKTKRGKADRSKVAGGEDYEVRYLAKQLGKPQTEIRKLIKAHGPSRAKIIAAVKKSK
ncbi:MAG TPA: DUF3606 domain-containing protein [Aestuariivirga sp.]|jgi:hypothetical protein|nr:DUF3606 domain-containing protein [Aestuariivirga sp.]